MKKPVLALFCFFIVVVPFFGCSSMSLNNRSERNHMLQTLAGGVVGQVVAGNIGGFIVGSFITDVVKTAKIQYEDMKVESGEEAARRLKNNIKQAEEKKPDEKKKAEEQKEKPKKVEKVNEQQKKAEEIKEKEKKAEEKKDIERKVEEKMRELEKKAEEQKKDQKAEEKKDLEKKAEELKEKQKKAEEIKEQQKKAEEQKDKEKKAEEAIDVSKRAALIINNATISPQITETGSKLETSVSYTLLGPESLKSSTITETRILTNRKKSFELDKRERSREQGTYSSTLKFTVSDEMPTGSCILYTMISDGEYTKTVKSEVIINK